MPGLKPLTIEVLRKTTEPHPVVFDRVIGGTIYLDEAKRIARRLLEVADSDIKPEGYRILTYEQQVVYEWHVADDEKTSFT
jgi:hypothetical protein